MRGPGESEKMVRKVRVMKGGRKREMEGRLIKEERVISGKGRRESEKRRVTKKREGRKGM